MLGWCNPSVTAGGCRVAATEFRCARGRISDRCQRDADTSTHAAARARRLVVAQCRPIAVAHRDIHGPPHLHGDAYRNRDRNGDGHADQNARRHTGPETAGRDAGTDSPSHSCHCAAVIGGVR
jgi:hypothetical protein